jgi:hypothetical protein
MEEILFKVPVPTGNIVNSVTLIRKPRRGYVLCFEYEDEDEVTIVPISLVFTGVEAFKCTHHLAIDYRKTRVAYEQVANLGKTPWHEEITSILSQREAEETNLMHLAIYFDSDDVFYEFICRSFDVEKNS